MDSNLPAGDELLEPFRPQRRRLASTDLTKSTSSIFGSIKQLQHNQSLSNLRPMTSTANHSSYSAQKGMSEINSYQKLLRNVVHDKEGFRKLKENMRKQHRSGFASKEVVYNLVMKERLKQIICYDTSPSSSKSLNDLSLAMQKETIKLLQQRQNSNFNNKTANEVMDKRLFMAGLKKSHSCPKEDFFSAFRSTMVSLRSQMPKSPSNERFRKRMPTNPCA